MITQETKSVKTWGGFNLAILKVNLNPLFPTHMLSLDSILGFCHRIAKGGDCKVEFNQPSC